SFCEVLEYGREVVDRASLALSHAQPIAGKPSLDAHSYLIQDPATNAAIMGFEYVPGGVVGLPFIRSTSPPWFTATVLGTVVGSARIGDVMLSSMPGEAYPQIALKVQDTVTGIRKGASQEGFMTMGLSNDQLGYIIAPFEAYPQPAQRTLFNNPLTQDVITACASGPSQDSCPTPHPISNDNYFFNVSHTLGERLTCAMLRGADDVVHPGQTAFRDSYSRCALFANDAQLPAGSDITLSATPVSSAPSVPTGSPDNP
ncbi:MAG TPA: hypothetical protein VGN69_08040, partial [Solirubrobacteraceae bacterium]|nr:hypothetical protein [Solirubrobacteraceae bacterium]